MTDTKVGNILHLLMGDMSESALARAVNLPKATIHRVLAGLTPDPRAGTLLPIAQYFNITIEQLMGITKLPNDTPLKSLEESHAIEMPFIEFEKLKQWIDQDYIPEKFYNIMSFSNKTMDLNCFITKMNSDEMAPLFSNKTYLIIRKQKHTEVDDIVLIFNLATNTFMVRKHIELKGEKYLFAANPSYDIINFDHKIELLGTVLEGRILI